MTAQPIFLLSLPRSGSTLVQRVIAAHPAVATRPEPWLLLPQFYALRRDGARYEYGRSGPEALRGFADSLRGGEAGYLNELEEFALRLYGRACDEGERYFLDKTPRYHFIVEELFRTFPRAKFIFLWRNPLAVVASLVQTWRHGGWSVDRWRMDLYNGLARLLVAADANADRSLGVRYEDLVTGSGWPSVFEYLELDFDAALLESFHHVTLPGPFGDPGRYQLGSLSTASVDKWVQTFDTPFRRVWARRYLRWVGPARLRQMGYDSTQLQEALNREPVRRPLEALPDALAYLSGRAVNARRVLMSRAEPREEPAPGS